MLPCGHEVDVDAATACLFHSLSCSLSRCFSLLLLLTHTHTHKHTETHTNTHTHTRYLSPTLSPWLALSLTHTHGRRNRMGYLAAELDSDEDEIDAPGAFVPPHSPNPETFFFFMNLEPRLE